MNIPITRRELIEKTEAVEELIQLICSNRQIIDFESVQEARDLYSQGYAEAIHDVQALFDTHGYVPPANVREAYKKLMPL